MEATQIPFQDIQTFVFLDLETTGLNNYARILELSMVAISSTDLLGMKKNPREVPELPRVVHKYTRLFYPRKTIMPNVEEISGLSNDKLCHLNMFNVKAVSGIINFLDFPSPICLVSHNGNGFDFPVLKAELHRLRDELDKLEEAKEFDKLLCIDTLQCIKKLDEIADIREAEEVAKLAGVLFDEEFNWENNQKTMIEQYNTPNKCNQDLGNVPVTPRKEMFIVTPEEKRSVPLGLQVKKVLFNDEIKPSTSSPQVDKLNVTSLSQNGNEFISQSNKEKPVLILNKMRPETKPYSQPTIYKRIFGREYEAHRAENDAVALLKICSWYGHDFLKWCSENHKLFSDIRPRGMCQAAKKS